MAKTDPINVSNPAGGSDRTLGDDYIRALARAVVEVLAVDHTMGASNPYQDTSGLTIGEHSKLSLNQVTKPAYAADKGFLYVKDVSGTTELFYEDEAGNEIQITQAGKIYLNGAYVASTLAPKTVDGADSSSVAVAGGGAIGLDRGGTLYVCGNEHATFPGQVILSPGYSTGSTAAIINALDHLISNVKDPESVQDAATKKYVDDSLTARVPTYAGGQSITIGTFILKFGYVSAGATDVTVTFGAAFPTGIVSVIAIPYNTSNVNVNAPFIKSYSASSFVIYNNGGASLAGYLWAAMGY